MDKPINIARKIRANSNDFCSGRINYETFVFRQRELWRAAETDGLANDVTDIIRKNMSVPLNEDIR